MQKSLTDPQAAMLLGSLILIGLAMVFILGATFIFIWSRRALRHVAQHWPYIGCALAALAVLAAPMMATAQPCTLDKPPCTITVAGKPKLTNAQALALLRSLRALDGRPVPSKDIPQPWDFGSGTLRMTIARNISALEEVEKAYNAASNAIVKEQLSKLPDDDKGKRPTTLSAGMPEFESYQKQVDALLGQPAEVTLFRIRASDLKLDKNEIPVTALSALLPVLDDDVSPKDAKQ